jgi:hypothetical protein
MPHHVRLGEAVQQKQRWSAAASTDEDRRVDDVDEFGLEAGKEFRGQTVATGGQWTSSLFHRFVGAGKDRKVHVTARQDSRDDILITARDSSNVRPDHDFAIVKP